MCTRSLVLPSRSLLGQAFGTASTLRGSGPTRDFAVCMPTRLKLVPCMARTHTHTAHEAIHTFEVPGLVVLGGRGLGNVRHLSSKNGLPEVYLLFTVRGPTS